MDHNISTVHANVSVTLGGLEVSGHGSVRPVPVSKPLPFVGFVYINDGAIIHQKRFFEKDTVTLQDALRHFSDEGIYVNISKVRIVDLDHDIIYDVKLIDYDITLCPYVTVEQLNFILSPISIYKGHHFDE